MKHDPDRRRLHLPSLYPVKRAEDGAIGDVGKKDGEGSAEAVIQGQEARGL